MSIPSLVTRYILFTSYLFLVVLSIAFTTISVFIDFSLRIRYSLELDDYVYSPALISAFASILICIVGICGCCGVIKENSCILGFLAFMMFTIVASEVSAIVYAIFNKDYIDMKMYDQLIQSQKEYVNPNTTVIKRSWDVFQHDFKCCGVGNASDWHHIFTDQKNLPSSCCSNLPINDDCTPKYAFDTGCFTAFTKLLHEHFVCIAVAGIIVFFIQILCIIASGFLARRIRTEYKTV